MIRTEAKSRCRYSHVCILAKKVEEEHCNKHRKDPDFTPCTQTRPMHLDMLKAFRADLAVLVANIDDRIQDLTRLPS